MQEQIKSASWSLGLWGVLSIVFGVLVMAWPDITVKAFLAILGVYLLSSGVVMTVGSLVRHQNHWIGGAIIGAISAVAGLYVFANPKSSALVLLSVIAIWSLAVGALQIAAGFEVNKQGGWLLVLSGAIQSLFGIYIFANPKGGAIALVWLIGLSVIASGIVLSIAAFKVGGLQRQMATMPPKRLG